MDIRNKRLLAALAALAVMLSAAGCGSKEKKDKDKARTTAVTSAEGEVSQITADDLEVGFDESDSTSVTFAEGSVEVKGSGAEAEGTAVTISAAGTYVLSGECSDGRIVVDAEKTDKVRLVLNGLELTCTSYAPLSVKKGEKVTLILEDGTENSFTDGESYVTTDEDNANGAVFCKSDLTINGGGSLTVNANCEHGIVSKDDIVITGGNISVNAASAAIFGKDSVSVSAGDIKLESGKDAVKSSNKKDETKGNISISGGSLSIHSDGDAFNAAGDITVSGGDINITTGEGAASVVHKQEMPQQGGTPGGFDPNNMPEDFDPSKMPGDFDPNNMPEGFDPSKMSGDFDPNNMPEGFDPNNRPGGKPEDGENDDALDLPMIPLDGDDTAKSDETEENSVSRKGLKAGRNITIEGGNISIDSADDSIHSKTDCTVKSGTLSLASGDDGIHVDNSLTVSGGKVDITKSYEGIEGKTVTISGGEINITASDDGINCADPEGSSEGFDMFRAQEGVALNITGGTLIVDSGGDGLDSNGDLIMSGGTVYVSGTENGGNGSVDHNGTASITGGTLIASSAVGMEEMFGENGTTQCAVLHDFSSYFPAGTEFTVKDSSGKVILSYTNPKTWQGVIFSSPELKQGETYTVSAGSESEEISLDSLITSNSTGFGGAPGMPGGGDRPTPPDRN